MAEPILHNSPPKEPNKSELKLPEIYLNGSQHEQPVIIESINALEELPPTIRLASVCYLPGPADHFVSIPEVTITNLTRPYADLSEIQGMLAKGGVL
jgi:hypothetical protein